MSSLQIVFFLIFSLFVFFGISGVLKISRVRALFVTNIIFLVLIFSENSLYLFSVPIVLLSSYYCWKVFKSIALVLIVNIIIFILFKMNIQSSYAIAVPLGFSFLILRVVSYFVDRKKVHSASGNEVLDYLNYVLFFPQFVSGPVTLWSEFQRESIKLRKITKRTLQIGFFLVISGLTKKFLISDSLFVLVREPLSKPDEFAGIPLILAVVLSKYLIFLDFVGYSEIARGFSRAIGFSANINFNRPFAATDMQGFWQRWHISLSNFFKKYVFQFLLISPVKSAGILGVLIATYILIGLWHKFTWLFVLYGVLQGFLLYYNRAIFNTFLSRAPTWFRSVLIYFFALSIPSLVFRLDSFEELAVVLRNLSAIKSDNLNLLTTLSPVSLVPVLIFAVIVEYFYYTQDMPRVVRKALLLPTWTKVLGSFLLLIVMLYYVDLSSSQPFIYSQY